MTPPMRIRPSFPPSQSLPTGGINKPLFLICQRADKMKPSVTENLSNWSHGPHLCLTQWNYEPCPVQFSSVHFSHWIASDSLWLRGLQHARVPVHHQVLELAQSHVHRGADAIQPSHSLLSPSPQTFKLSQHQDLLHWVSSSYQVPKVGSRMLSFKPTFCLSSFTFIERLFRSSSLSAIKMVSSEYLRLLIFLLGILIPSLCFIQPGISHDVLCIYVK